MVSSVKDVLQAPGGGATARCEKESRMKDVQTGFRISEIQNEQVTTIATLCGMTKNSTLKMLVSLGIQAFKNAEAKAVPEPLRAVLRTPQSAASPHARSEH